MPFLRRSVLRAILFSFVLGAALSACKPAKPPAAWAGFRPWESAAWVAVPGGSVNAAGGTLAVGRRLLSIDTRLGALAVDGVHHSGSAGWRWSFELSLLDGVFEDASGARFEVGALAPGTVVPGTDWVKIDASRMKTRGGLVHAFDTAGRLSAIHWSSDPSPFLAFQPGLVGSEVRIVAIEQCTAPAACEPIYTLGWDPEGRLSYVEDRAGRRAELAWDAAGRLAAARDAGDVAAGLPGSRYGYAGDLLASVLASDGEAVVFEYADGRLAAAVAQGPGSPTHTFAYQRLGPGSNRTTHTAPTGAQLRIDWDDQRRVSQRTLVDLDETESFAWDGLRLAQRTAPDGTAAVWSWLDEFLVDEQIAGNTRLYQWNPEGVNRLDPAGGALAELRDDMGLILSVSYDAAGRPVAVTNGEGEAILLGWIGIELVSHTTSSGVVRSFEGYGEHGWPTVIRQGGAVVDQPEYDLVGNRLRGLDFSDPTSSAMPGVIERSFDADRNVASLTLVEEEPDGSATTERTLAIERRGDGRPLRILRPYGGDTEYGYDGLGRRVERRERVDGEFQVTAYEHDASGRRTAEEKPNGMRSEWSFDAAGRVLSWTALRHGVVESVLTRTFASGRLVSVDDSVRGGSEVYLYDAEGRVERVVHPGGEDTALVHDARGLVTELSLGLPGGQLLRTLAFEYDAVGRETALRDGGPAGAVLLARSFADARLAETRYGNGLTRSYAYAAGTDLWESAATTAADGTWVADTVMAASGGTWTGASLTVRTADPLGLVPEPPPFGEPGIVETGEVMWVDTGDEARPHGPRLRMAYELANFVPGDARYDALGNQLYSSRGQLGGGAERRNYHYNDEHNRLLEITDLVWNGSAYVEETFRTYGYDQAGYVAAVDGLPITWTAHGRIAAVGESASFVWDAAGRPVSRTVMGEQTDYWFGGLLEAAPGEIPDTLDLGEVRLDLAAGDHRYRHFGPHGKVKFVTDPAGIVVAHHYYGPYGRRTSWGPETDGRGFAGGQHAAGFIALGARILDPEAGRFLSPDPIDPLLDAYAYAWGNPLHLWDPTGLHPTPAPQGPPRAATALDILGLAFYSVAVVLAPFSLAAGSIAAVLGFAARATATAMRDEAARRDAGVTAPHESVSEVPSIPGVGLEGDFVCGDDGCFRRGPSIDPRPSGPPGGVGSFAFELGSGDGGCGGSPASCGLGQELVLILPWLLRVRLKKRAAGDKVARCT